MLDGLTRLDSDRHRRHVGDDVIAPLRLPAIGFRGVTLLTVFEAARLSAVLPPGWTHPTLDSLRDGSSPDAADVHMLFDIHLRDGLDAAWRPPPDEPEMHPPEYAYLDLAVARIQQACPGLIDEFFGDRPPEPELG